MKGNEKGQSTIEFLMSIIFSMGILYLFISLGINYTNGYLVHYVTYSASRAFMVADGHNLKDTAGTSNDLARNLAEKVLGGFPLEALGIKLSQKKYNYNDGTSKYEFVGVVYSFKAKLSTLMMVGGDAEANMISESFLGRTQTRADSALQICNAINSLPLKYQYASDSACNDSNSFSTLYDNGD